MIDFTSAGSPNTAPRSFYDISRSKQKIRVRSRIPPSTCIQTGFFVWPTETRLKTPVQPTKQFLVQKNDTFLLCGEPKHSPNAVFGSCVGLVGAPRARHVATRCLCPPRKVDPLTGKKTQRREEEEEEEKKKKKQ